jgi:L-fucose isomerase
MRQSTYVWPHAFTRMDAPAEVFLSRFGANHIHAVPGDFVEELAACCRFLDIELDMLDDANGPVPRRRDR